MCNRIGISTGMLLLMCMYASGEVPLMMNHQGLVKVDGEPFTGTGLFKFGLVDVDGKWLWTNDGTHLGETANIVSPDQPISLLTSNGIYHVRLGDTEYINMVEIPSSVFAQAGVSLRIIFNDGMRGEQTIVPDEPLTSVAYAYRAANADNATLVTGRSLDEILVPGEVKMWAGSIASIPEGWLLCDGSEVSRTTYSRLFSAIGEIYGTGDGGTTFNLPDFRDRSPMGASQDEDGAAKTNVTDSLLQEGGEALHVLTVEEMPSHGHDLRDFASSEDGHADIVITDFITHPIMPDRSKTSTKNTGANQPHNNVHPFFSVVFIIRY